MYIYDVAPRQTYKKELAGKTSSTTDLFTVLEAS